MEPLVSVVGAWRGIAQGPKRFSQGPNWCSWGPIGVIGGPTSVDGMKFGKGVVIFFLYLFIIISNYRKK
jgi:hypothetical protein